MVIPATGLTFSIPASDIGIALAMGVFQLGTGLIIYTAGSKVVPAAELTLISMTEVVLGPLWVWMVLGETAGLLTLLGGFILLAGIAGNAISACGGDRFRWPCGEDNYRLTRTHIYLSLYPAPDLRFSLRGA